MTTQIIEQKELRVYVGTFGKYNRGSLAGKWLNIKTIKTLMNSIKHVDNYILTNTIPNLCSKTGNIYQINLLVAVG